MTTTVSHKQQTLKQLGKRTHNTHSERAKLTSLEKWFNKVVEKKDKSDVSRNSTTSMDEDEIVLQVMKKKRKHEINESRLSQKLKDWILSTPLSVAVTSSASVEKSTRGLLNTLLEATVQEEENYSTFVDEDLLLDLVDDKYSQNTSYNFDGSCNDDSDLQWLNGTARSKKSRAGQVKHYGKATNYSFECEESDELSYEPFSVTDLTKREEEEHSDEMIQEYDERPLTYKRATVYMWDHEDSTQETEYEFENVGTIDHNFAPDEEFLGSIDWDKERMMMTSNDMNNNRMILDTENSSQDLASIEIEDARSFLLPQEQFVPGQPAQTFVLRYGKVPSLIVSFPTEREVRLALWKLHEVQQGTLSVENVLQLNIMRARYRLMLGLSESQEIPLPYIHSPQDFHLDTLVVLKLLGKNFRFTGLGKDLQQDRVYIREKIKETISKYSYFMVKFMVRVPCKVLEGNRELIEVSSSSMVTDHNAQLAIQNANLLMIAVDTKQGLCTDVASALKTCGVTNKILADRFENKAIFLGLSNDCLPKFMNQEEKFGFDEFKERLLLQWKQIIYGTLPGAPGSSNSVVPSGVPLAAFTSQNIERMISDSLVLHTNPALFSSIHLRGNFPYELLGGYSLREVLNATSIPTLLSIIPNRQLVKFAKQIRILNRKYIKYLTQYENQREDIVRPDTQILKMQQEIQQISEKSEY
eukprot:TRINITY_DN3154_c0_g1_i1.p1 TRINITY_DN3154_c0_g1~~TRINITY_DN3154_c0_g1_i1.p1  ORF type:complete len:698 (-),score=184.97 TRINITY_DN3154_c0_g1_i1:114-2207(-)